MKQGYFIVSLMCMLTSCGGYKKSFVSPKKPSNVQENKLIEQIAKLDDIPFPCQASFISSPFSAESTEQKIIKFYTQMSLALVINFYRQNMEFFGWKEDISYNDENLLAYHEEGLLSFKKPDRWCIVSIRPQNKKNTLVVVFIGKRTESE